MLIMCPQGRHTRESQRTMRATKVMLHIGTHTDYQRDALITTCSLSLFHKTFVPEIRLKYVTFVPFIHLSRYKFVLSTFQGISAEHLHGEKEYYFQENKFNGVAPIR